MKASRSRSYVHRRLPKIPKTMPSLMGPVTVTQVKDLKSEDGKDCYGIFRHYKRDTRLDADMAPELAWQTYWHEWAHAVLRDSGIRIRGELEERVCDAFGLARLQEMQGR